MEINSGPSFIIFSSIIQFICFSRVILLSKSNFTFHHFPVFLTKKSTLSNPNKSQNTKPIQSLLKFEDLYDLHNGTIGISLVSWLITSQSCQLCVAAYPCINFSTASSRISNDTLKILSCSGTNLLNPSTIQH